MLGKLQSNKVKYAVKIFDYIHSVDSKKIAQKIADEEAKVNKKIKIFIQVNTGLEQQKGGIEPEKLSELMDTIQKELELDNMKEGREKLLKYGTKEYFVILMIQEN